MVKLAGSKNISLVEERALSRTKSVQVKEYNRGVTITYGALIDSFTKKDYETWRQYQRRWGKYKRSAASVHDRMIQDNISGPCLELAKIRRDDVYTAQKIIGCLKYRWTNATAEKIKNVNSDPDVFWKDMASKIQRRSRSEGTSISKDWQGADGKIRLASYLKNLYNAQQGLCAISKEPMELAISSRYVGTAKKMSSKCSPDRINSNRGYVKGNIHLTTWWINWWKSSLSLTEFKEKINIVANAIR